MKVDVSAAGQTQDDFTQIEVTVFIDRTIPACLLPDIIDSLTRSWMNYIEERCDNEQTTEDSKTNIN